MMSNLKNTVRRTLTNVKGQRIDDKIIVFESDDWGSIRMPNKEIREKFENKGYKISTNPYCQFDTLATSVDLERLFNVLQKHKDKDGNHPVFTANTVVANPNFDAIKASGYTKYSYKPFTTTLKEYYPEDDVYNKWLEGMQKKIFIPQYHGREHLNVPLWLNVLRSNNKPFVDAFNMGFWGLPNNLYDKNIFNIQAAYCSAKVEDIEYYKSSIIEGLNLFEKIFGYRSKTFIANNYTWSPKLDETLKKNGVIAFQGMKYQKIAAENGSSIHLKPVYTGKKNDFKQLYIVRNCVFEPSQMDDSFNNVKNCIKDIENSFLFKKPAVIASHRLNFIGAISVKNREKNLVMLDELLEEILKRWPDVKFMSSDILVDYLNKH
jgi:hypothetical protein